MLQLPNMQLFFKNFFFPFFFLASLWANSAGKLASSEKIKIIFLGDSLTEGYNIPEGKDYVTLLTKKYSNLNLNIINGSISGSTSASAIGRMKWYLKLKPDIIVLALGANDGLRGSPIESMKKNLSTAIEMAKKEGIILILAGMKIPRNYGEDYYLKFEKTFDDLAQKYKLPYIPFLLKGVAGVKEMNIADSIHPNEAGHKLMLKNVEPILMKEIRRLKKEK